MLAEIYEELEKCISVCGEKKRDQKEKESRERGDKKQEKIEDKTF